MLDFESCHSLEKLVVDNEICGMAQRLVRGIEPRDDFPARPLFEELLREKHLLIAKHTRRHLRDEIAFPGPVIDRANQARWPDEGGLTLGAARAARGRAAGRGVGAVAARRRRQGRTGTAHGVRGPPGRHGRSADARRMKQRIEWRPADTLPERREVLRLQGIPAGVDPSPRILSIVESAEAVYLETAEPRALVADISQEAFAGVYRGEGRNAPVTPLEAVVPARGRAGAVCRHRRRARHRAHQDSLRAERAGAGGHARRGRLGGGRSSHSPRRSIATRRLADDAAGRGRLTLGYSPGYCGWHVSGQRALFACLQPEEIGVTLNASCLMEPLKSVSGVLVAGPADIHRFAPGYAFCADCRTKTCLGRVQRWSIPASAG